MLGRHVHFPKLPSSGPVQFDYKDMTKLDAKAPVVSSGVLDLYKNYKFPKFIHGSFVINIGKKHNSHLMKMFVKNLSIDLEFCDQIGGVGVILHYGAPGEQVNQAIPNLKYILRKTKWFRSKIIIENRKGTKIEEMFELQQKFPGRLGFCFDTCHLYISGYEINKLGNMKKMFKFIKKVFPDLLLLHLNDAKSQKKDEHAEPGTGYIGSKSLGGTMENFEFLVCLFPELPMIVEV